VVLKESVTVSLDQQRRRRGIWQPGASAKRSGARRPW